MQVIQINTYLTYTEGKEKVFAKINSMEIIADLIYGLYTLEFRPERIRFKLTHAH